MASPRKLELTALFGLMIQIAFVCTAFALYSASGSTAVFAEMWHLAAGVLVWFIVLLHGRQRRLAAQEEQELAELKKTRLSEELFEEMELDTLRARTGLVIFEKYLVPVLSILFSGILFFLTYYLAVKTWPSYAVQEIRNPAAVGVGMIFIAFVGFLVGKYGAGIAQSPQYRLLRASSAYMLGNVAASLLVAVSMGAVHFGIRWPERVTRFVIPVGLGLVGVEVVLNLILDIYRPRVAGQPSRPPYDSRLLGLFAEPGGILKTVAATLDYQFGFKVSETWFYRFMQRAILPLILIQLVTLWLLSCLVVVDPNEIAFIERFGRPRLTEQDARQGLKATVYQPGYYLKAPWPFDSERHVPAYEVQKLEIGRIRYDGGEERPETEERGPVMTDPDIILWTEEHINPEEGYEPNLLVPSFEKLSEEESQEKLPELNLARVLAYVHFRVKRRADGTVDPQAVYRYYYKHADARQLVEHLAYSVLCRLAASQHFLKWVNVEREKCNRYFRAELQRAIDERQLGAEVVMAGIPVVHAPPQVADAYQDVINAFEEKEATIYDGRAVATSTLQDGMAKAVAIKEGGRRDGYTVQTLAKADANRFLIQLDAYRKAPEVYEYRKYFTTVEDLLAGHRLYIVPRAPDEVHVLDLQEKLRPELLDFNVEEAAK